MPESNSIQLLDDLENEVHVWSCCPDKITENPVLEEYLSILSADELAKYKRFHFEKDRHSYLVSHALVRKVLSSYCNVKPDEWGFMSNQHGKPDISPEINCPALKFNLSHTDGMSVCVVSLENDCGIDVENAQRKSRTFAVADRMFAPAEVATMRSGNDSEVQRKFFEFWTLRESYVKAIGTGLGGSSKAFYFSVDEQGDDRREARIHFVPSDKGKSSIWKFLLLKLSGQHVAAISVKTENIKKIVSQKIQP